jgi:hypothetical protein
MSLDEEWQKCKIAPGEGEGRVLHSSSSEELNPMITTLMMTVLIHS